MSLICHTCRRAPSTHSHRLTQRNQQRNLGREDGGCGCGIYGGGRVLVCGGRDGRDVVVCDGRVGRDVVVVMVVGLVGMLLLFLLLLWWCQRFKSFRGMTYNVLCHNIDIEITLPV